jgi:hypothetical protein
MCQSGDTKKIMTKLGFDQDEQAFIANIIGDSPQLPSAIIGLASIKLSASLVRFTKWLTISTCILAVAGLVQICIAFCGK